jgi:hypothetical protein
LSNPAALAFPSAIMTISLSFVQHAVSRSNAPKK